jgi:hypothetical protein
LTLSLSFPVNCSKKIVLQIWENFAEGEVVPSGANVEAKQKEVLKVRWNV